MKNNLIFIGVVGLLALIAGNFLTAVAPIEPIQHEPVLEKPEPPKQEPVSDVKNNKVKRLDLTKANLTFLTSAVSARSVDEVINDISEYNRNKSKEIFLIIDSPGGSVLDGARLMTAIENSKAKVSCIDVGMAASMGFMILEHCHNRYAVSRATLMSHPASLGVLYQGELDKIVSRLTYIKRFVDKMDKFIAKRAGMTYERLKLLNQQELWLDSVDALEMGLLDAIVDIDLPSVSETSPDSGSNRFTKEFKLE